MRVRFTYRRAVEDELRRDRTVERELDRSADKIATAAKGFAPIRTGRYRSSIAVAHEPGDGGGEISIVRAAVPYAAFVEFGTRYVEPKHPLALGVEVVTR